MSAKKSEFTYSVSESLSLIFFVLAVFTFLGYQAWAAFIWLKSGTWPSLPFATFGLSYVGRILDDANMVAWAVNPGSWIGLHKILDSISVGTGSALSLALVGWFFSGLAEEAK